MQFDQFRRRDFVRLLLGGAASGWPLAARAQQAAKIPRIGIIDDAPMWHSFRQALREFGYVEGQRVRAGLVASLARPGGNLTGNTVLSPDLGAKRLQLLREAIARVSRVAY